jgi:hypothetical protein
MINAFFVGRRQKLKKKMNTHSLLIRLYIIYPQMFFKTKVFDIDVKKRVCDVVCVFGK